MKKCGYCGRDNEDVALSCWECGSEFFDPTAQAARAAAEIDPDDPVDEELLPSAPETNDQQRSGSPSIEYWLLFAIGVSASGGFYITLSVVVLYLLFKRLQPRADWELLMVVSGFAGICLFRILYVTAGHAGPVHLAEPVLVIVISVILLITHQRHLASVLLAYSAIGVILELLAVLLQFKDVSPKYAIFRAILLGLSAWLIRHWLKRNPRHISSSSGIS